MSNLLLSSSYSAIIDIVALCIIVLFAIMGFKNGFIKTFFKTFGTIIGLLLAVLLCSRCAIFLENQFGMISSITEKISGLVTRTFGDSIANTTLSEAVESSLSDSGLSSFLIKIIMEAKLDSSIPLDTTLNQIISPALSYYVACGLSIVILFIILKILMFIIGDITSKLSAFGLVGATNRALGLLLGLLQSVVTIQLILIIINVIPIGFLQTFSLEVRNSVVVNFIDKINVFELIIRAISKTDILTLIKGSL